AGPCAGAGRSCAETARSAVLYRSSEQPGDPAARDESLKQYRAARSAWAELAAKAKGVYLADITVGEHPQLRGHWLDRLPAIDADIAAIAALPPRDRQKAVPSAIKEALSRPRRTAFPCHHTPQPK